MRASAILVLAGCGRIGFAAQESDPDAPLDTVVVDAPAVAPSFVQHIVGYGTGVTNPVVMPQPVTAGSALVAFALSQEMPDMTITDTQTQDWQRAGVIVSGLTGSKVNAWFVCNAKPGAETVSLTQSFNNGPVHISVFEIAGAALSGCVDQKGQNVVSTAATDQSVSTSGPLASPDQIVLAGFGAWFDEVSYTADAGDQVFVTARPFGTPPMGDSLGSVVSKRTSGPQTVHLTADHATLYAALIVTVR